MKRGMVRLLLCRARCRALSLLTSLRVLCLPSAQEQVFLVRPAKAVRERRDRHRAARRRRTAFPPFLDKCITTTLALDAQALARRNDSELGRLDVRAFRTLGVQKPYLRPCTEYQILDRAPCRASLSASSRLRGRLRRAWTSGTWTTEGREDHQTLVGP